LAPCLLGPLNAARRNQLIMAFFGMLMGHGEANPNVAAARRCDRSSGRDIIFSLYYNELWMRVRLTGWLGPALKSVWQSLDESAKIFCSGS